MGKYVKDKIELAFDPEKAGGEIKDVFDDDFARLFWLLFRPFGVCQRFNSKCLCASRDIKQEGIPLDMEALDWFVRLHFYYTGYPLNPVSQDCVSEDNLYGKREFLEEIFPYLKGEKVLSYQIIPETKHNL